MSTPPSKKPNLSDPSTTRWPLQVHQYSYGWTITYFGPDGHVRHVATAGSEMEAYRLADRLAHIYHIRDTVLIHSNKGTFVRDLDKLMHHEHE